MKCVRIKENKALWGEMRSLAPAFAVFFLLALITLAVALQSIVSGQWHRAFVCVLTLLLLLVPSSLERLLALRLPCTLHVFAYLFIFASGMLGEIARFYEYFFFWDDMLHAISGFMFAAFGFCLVSLAERGRETRTYAPILVVLLAFCFSMTAGVFWELFEFAADAVLGLDMQKDTMLHALHTVSLSGAGEGTVHLRDVTRTVVCMANGEEVVLSGYLDVGLADTMLDLFINALGALIFCAIGYVHLRGVGGRLARQFIPRVLEKEKG